MTAPGGRGQSAQIAPQPPLGWAACEVTLTHCKARGGALGHWQIVVWYPRRGEGGHPLHPLTPSCGSRSDRWYRSGWPRHQCGSPSSLPTGSWGQLLCGSRWRSLDWGGGQRPEWCINGIFSRPQTSPRQSCSLQWAVSRDLASNRSHGLSWRLSGTYQS